VGKVGFIEAFYQGLGRVRNLGEEGADHAKDLRQLCALHSPEQQEGQSGWNRVKGEKTLVML
jgi:hypothetical protein